MTTSKETRSGKEGWTLVPSFAENTMASLSRAHTMVMTKCQDAIFSKELSQLLVVSHMLCYTVAEAQHTPRR